MKDVLENISAILGIVISCITIYQFFAKRPSATRVPQEELSQLPQELNTVPSLTKASSVVGQVPSHVEHSPTRKYFFALVTFVVMPIVAFFLLFFYATWSGYSFTVQEALLANSIGALLAGSTLALMILLTAPSRPRALFAVGAFVIIYCLVLFGLILLNNTIYYSVHLFDSSLAGGNVVAVIAASLVALAILRGTPPSQQHYVFGLVTLVMVLIVTFLGPILYSLFTSSDVTQYTIAGGSAIAVVGASISALTILFSKGTTRKYTVTLVIFALVYFVTLTLLVVIVKLTYISVFALFNEESIGASTIAFVGGGLVAFFFLKGRGWERWLDM